MNVATSTRGVDVICLNDKGESLAEGEPHQSHARITLRRRWESSRTHTLMLMDKHSNSNVGVINYCQHGALEERLGPGRPRFCSLDKTPRMSIGSNLKEKTNAVSGYRQRASDTPHLLTKERR